MSSISKARRSKPRAQPAHLSHDLARHRASSTNPTSRWHRNRYWADSSGVFVKPNGQASRFDVTDTGGCSREVR
ncbi:MAG: hypothetical protein GY708_12535 [Actinomycetia bacterium]|nr:hypothetical protein [Actinomycetes bacterium]